MVVRLGCERVHQPLEDGLPAGPEAPAGDRRLEPTDLLGEAVEVDAQPGQDPRPAERFAEAIVVAVDVVRPLAVLAGDEVRGDPVSELAVLHGGTLYVPREGRATRAGR